MQVVIVDAKGAIRQSRPLTGFFGTPDEGDAAIIAEQYAESKDREVSPRPFRCYEGDIIVQFRPEPDSDPITWDCYGFFFTE
jgi:hypothetical protein